MLPFGVDASLCVHQPTSADNLAQPTATLWDSLPLPECWLVNQVTSGSSQEIHFTPLKTGGGFNPLSNLLCYFSISFLSLCSRTPRSSGSTVQIGGLSLHLGSRHLSDTHIPDTILRNARIYLFLRKDLTSAICNSGWILDCIFLLF